MNAKVGCKGQHISSHMNMRVEKSMAKKSEGGKLCSDAFAKKK
jgi:hypothetical protein